MFVGKFKSPCRISATGAEFLGHLTCAGSVFWMFHPHRRIRIVGQHAKGFGPLLYTSEDPKNEGQAQCCLFESLRMGVHLVFRFLTQ
jgi:hypothetical protein